MASGRLHPTYGLPEADLPARLAECPAGDDALADDGAAILVLLEIGEQTRTASLLDAATRDAIRDGKPERTVLCHLLKALAKGFAGELEPARRWLDRALAVPVPGGLDPGLKRLQSRVGVELSLLLGDPAELDVFLRDLEASCDVGAHARLAGSVALWRAEAALRRGELVEADRHLEGVAIPADPSAAGEPGWQALRLRGEVAAARGAAAAAARHLDQAREAQAGIAARLPEALRQPYLLAPRRAAVMERLLRIREGTQVRPAPGTRGVSSTRLLAAFRAILEGIRTLERHGSLAPLLDYALDAMIRHGGARRGLVVLTDQGEDVRIERGRHLEGRALRSDEMQVSRTIALKAAREVRTIVLEDATTDAEFSRAGSVVALGIRSALAIPLLVEGRSLGAIYLDDPQRVGLFGPDAVEAIEVLAGHAALAIAHARLVERVTRDLLTGAYTHGFFQEQLQRSVSLARRHGRSCGLVLLDVDNFKQINDCHGHEFGNRVLQAFSEALRGALRETDYVGQPATDGARADEVAHFGRFGGDEFEILLLETGPDGLAVVGRKIADAVRALRFEHDGAIVTVTTSAGGACFPAHARTAEDLFRLADEALYQAKRAGRDRFVLSGAVPAKAEIADPEVDSLLLTREGRTALGMLGRLLEQDSDLEALLRRTLGLMANATGAERGFLLMPDGSGEGGFRLVLGMDELEVAEAERRPVSSAVLARLTASRKAVLIEDAFQDPILAIRDSVVLSGVRSILAVPLPLPDNEFGAAYLDIRRGDHRFTREDLALLQVFIRRIAPVIANARRLWIEGRRVRALEDELRRLRETE